MVLSRPSRGAIIFINLLADHWQFISRKVTSVQTVSSSFTLGNIRRCKNYAKVTGIYAWFSTFTFVYECSLHMNVIHTMPECCLLVMVGTHDKMFKCRKVTTPKWYRVLIYEIYLLYLVCMSMWLISMWTYFLFSLTSPFRVNWTMKRTGSTVFGTPPLAAVLW